MLGNGFAGSANMAESRFAAALLTIILLSKVEVAIGGNIENKAPRNASGGALRLILNATNRMVKARQERERLVARQERLVNFKRHNSVKSAQPT